MRGLVTEWTQEETNKGKTLQDKHCAGTSGGEFNCDPPKQSNNVGVETGGVMSK